jgi:uncharacterized protein GlcG (DUF336 family)
MALPSEIAQRMIRVSQDKARELGVAVSTAIVDADGRLFAFARMEASGYRSRYLRPRRSLARFCSATDWTCSRCQPPCFRRCRSSKAGD